MSPILLSIGVDNQAKLWRKDGSWSCISCPTYRNLPATAGGWSGDGTLLGISFGHVITLWDSQCNLKLCLSVHPSVSNVRPLRIGV